MRGPPLRGWVCSAIRQQSHNVTWALRSDAWRPRCRCAPAHVLMQACRRGWYWEGTAANACGRLERSSPGEEWTDIIEVHRFPSSLLDCYLLSRVSSTVGVLRVTTAGTLLCRHFASHVAEVSSPSTTTITTERRWGGARGAWPQAQRRRCLLRRVRARGVLLSPVVPAGGRAACWLAAG